MKKELCLCLLAATLLLLFPGCREKIRDDLDTRTLESALTEVIPTDGGYRVSDADVLLEFENGGELPTLRDFLCVHAVSARNINEFGIFHAESDPEGVKNAVGHYLDDLKLRYGAMNYLPAEREKWEDAQIRVYGNYVVYTVLGESDSEAFYEKVKSLLTEKGAV